MDSETPAFRHDEGKLRIDLVPASVLLEIAEVFTFGCKKYGDVNWQKGMNWSRAYGSCLRHLFAWASGQDKDPESGLSHLSHAASNIIHLIYYTKKNKGTDDRSVFH